MVKKSIYILVLILLSAVTFSFAETIVLKSGKQIEGKLAEQTNDYIKIDIQGATFTYFNDEIDSINGQRFISDINKNNGLTENKNTPATFANNERLDNEVKKVAKGFWSFRIGLFVRDTVLKYGKPFFIFLYLFCFYFLLPGAIILITFFLLKSVKYVVPFPVVFVFAILISNIVNLIYAYLLAENFSQLVAQLEVAISSQNFIQVMKMHQFIIQGGHSLGYMRAKVFIAGVVNISAAAYLLTLQKGARKIVIWILIYSVVIIFLLSLFGRASGETLFEAITTLFIAHFCLNEQYFHD